MADDRVTGLPFDAVERILASGGESPTYGETVSLKKFRCNCVFSCLCHRRALLFIAFIGCPNQRSAGGVTGESTGRAASRFGRTECTPSCSKQRVFPCFQSRTA